MIAVVIQVPLVDGKPKLDLPNNVEVVREGRYAHVSWGDGRCLTLRHLGTPASGPVFCGMMEPRVAQALAHLGANVLRLRDAWQNATMRTWLLNNGVSERDGFPVTPHCVAGVAPFADGAPAASVLPGG